MKVKVFTERLKKELGPVMGEARLKAVRLGLVKAGLIERNNQDISCEGAAWYIYAYLFAPSTNYQDMVNWAVLKKSTMTSDSPFSAFWGIFTDDSLVKSLSGVRIDLTDQRLYMIHGEEELEFEEDAEVEKKPRMVRMVIEIEKSFFTLLSMFLEGAKKSISA